MKKEQWICKKGGALIVPFFVDLSIEGEEIVYRFRRLIEAINFAKNNNADLWFDGIKRT